ncbi:MAG TPA: hypothetical protein VNS09_13660, partial [Solirubrobacter sp.]|nr:hypothetical protein [Solirubrobacter sp.]
MGALIPEILSAAAPVKRDGVRRRAAGRSGAHTRGAPIASAAAAVGVALLAAAATDDGQRAVSHLSMLPAVTLGCGALIVAHGLWRGARRAATVTAATLTMGALLLLAWATAFSA